ncbi:MAG TPA: hypothetical protein VGB91_12145 [Rhizomicrobium sp.]
MHQTASVFDSPAFDSRVRIWPRSKALAAVFASCGAFWLVAAVAFFTFH